MRYVTRWIPAPPSAIPFLFLLAVSLIPASAFADTNTLSFSQNHQLWDRGADIAALQQFLNAQGFVVAQIGPGSAGHETTLFGLLTYNALLKYQAAHDLPATGYFGPTTRAFVSGSAATNSSSASMTGGTQNRSQITSSATSSQSTISASLPFASLSFGGGGEGGGGGSAVTTPSCTIGASLPSVTLGNSSLLTWSTTNASSASLTGAGAVALSGSQNETPNTTSAYTLTVTSSTGTIASCSVTVTVIGSGDTTPPTVSLTAPANGATVSGAAVLLSATASDNVAVADVQFKLGNANIESAIFVSPYATTWNTTGTTTPDGSYTLSAVAADTSGNLATSSVIVTVRNTPPIVSSIATSSSYTTATTTWTTDEAATSKLVYGLTTGYGSASSSASFVTSHSIILSGLTASSTYHFAVVSTDAGGNTSTSTDQTFTTPATSTPPVLSSISSGTPTTTAATITWSTDQSSNSKVVWGLTTGYGSASSSAPLLTSHSIILGGLATSTTYHYAVVSANIFGATATSSDQTFTTASRVPDTTPPTTPTNLVASPISSSQINLSWIASTDNVGVAGYRVYRDGSQVGTTTSGTTYNDTGLSPSTFHSYWIAAYDAAGNVSTTTGTTIGVTQAGADQFGTTWHDLKIGGGGFVTGIDIAPDGTKVIRTDTYGAYLWDGTQWDQLVSTSSMPSNVLAVDNNAGVYEIRVAPSNSNILYMTYLGNVYRSANKGATWSQTTFPNSTSTAASVAGGGDSYRYDGQKLAVDPANPNVVYAGTTNDGLWVTSDGGNTWTRVSGVPAGVDNEGGMTGITFDPSSGTTGGKTNTIYVGSWGKGVWQSTNAGGTWMQLTGGPTTVNNATIASSTYYAADGSAAWKYSGGAWTDINNSDSWHSIAVDPANPERIIIGQAGGFLDQSLDGGATWGGGEIYGSVADPITNVATDVPWLAWTNDASYKTNGNMVFDPTASNKLYFAEGIGVWYTNLSTTQPWNVGPVWNSQTIGIEQIVANQIISPPGGKPIVGSDDRPIFYINNPDTYPTSGGPNNNHSIVHGYSLDWASNNPSFIAGIIDWFGVEESGYSTNGGQTWSQFAEDTPISGGLLGGSIAAASSTNIIWAPEDNGVPFYTKDGGNTWTQINAPGAPTTGTTGWGFAYYLDQHIVAADRVNIGTFYAYNYLEGLYKSTDGGVTWTLEHSVLDGYGDFNSDLQAMPNEAGELFFTGGYQTPGPHPVNESFWRSTNGGSTWTAVPNVLEVRSVGFGAPAVGTTTPAIYIVGWVNSIYGIWRSTDNASTWAQIGSWPLNSFDDIKTITGDMNTYGRVYVGFSGSGYSYGDTSDAAPSVWFATPTTNSAVSGSVTLAATSSGRVAISSVQFEVDGTDIGSAISSAPYTASWNSTSVSDGIHTLYTVSKNTAGTYATSSISITVGNTPPSTPTNLVASSTSSQQINLSWTAATDTIGIAGYQIFRNNSEIATSTQTSYADTGLAEATTYTYLVKAYDAVGNVSASSTSAMATTQSGITFTPTAAPATQYLAYPSPSTATFSSVNIGTASSGRIVVVGVGDQNSGNCPLASVIIGGTGATEATTTTDGEASLWYANIASGTSADIVVTCTGVASFHDIGIQVGALTGATLTPSSTGVFNFAYAAQPQTVTATVPSNGVGVVFATEGENSTTTPPLPSWTNTTGDSYSNDTTGDNNPTQVILAHTYTAGSQTPSISSNGTAYNFVGTAMVMATWAP